MNRTVDSLKFLEVLVEDYGLVHYYKDQYTLVIHDRKGLAAVEVLYLDDCTYLYYFSDYTNDALSYCTEIDYTNTESFQEIEKWIKKLVIV